MSYNITHMSSRATIPEYQPLGDTKGVTKTRNGKRNGKRNGMKNGMKRKICNAIYAYLS